MSKVVLEQSEGPATSSEVNKETKVEDNYKEGSKVEEEEIDNKLRSEGSDKEAVIEKHKHVSGSGKEVDEGLEDVKNAFDGRDGFTIVHNLAQFETPSTYLNCGLDRCCELDTKNKRVFHVREHTRPRDPGGDQSQGHLDGREGKI